MSSLQHKLDEFSSICEGVSKRFADVQRILLAKLASVFPTDLARPLARKILLQEVLEVFKEEPLHSVPSLVELCAKRVGSDKGVVDTLFAVYGPDTNFPFPTWVASKVTSLRHVDDFESVYKLSLLLSNNASTWASLSTYYEEDETEATIALSQLAWKKLSTVSKKLQYVSAKYFRDVPSCFCQIDIILPAIQQLHDLRELELPDTIFLDEDLQVVGASLQQLRSFTFKIDGRVTEVGVQALGQLKKLEELLFDYDSEVCKGSFEDLADARDSLIVKCLGTLPWLKVLCAPVELEFYYEHVLPLMVEKVPLALEQLQFIEFLKVSKASMTGLNKQIPLLSNVRFLRIFELENDEEMIKRLVEVEMNKVENLFVEGAIANPAYALIDLIGSNLSVIEFKGCNGAWNFLRILDSCPKAEHVTLHCITRDDNGYYSFNNFSHLQHTPQNLKSLSLELKNKHNFELPPGVLTRLVAGPKLEFLKLKHLPLSAEDCQDVSLKLKHGTLKMDNFTSFIFCCSEGNEFACDLLAAICAFCPKLDYLQPSGFSSLMLDILKSMFEPKILISSFSF